MTPAARYRAVLADFVDAVDKRVTRAELARKLGVSRATVTQALKPQGKNGPAIGTLLRIADAAGLEMEIVVRPKEKR